MQRGVGCINPLMINLGIRWRYEYNYYSINRKDYNNQTTFNNVTNMSVQDFVKVIFYRTNDQKLSG
jgi:hypothetical protein